ncbi:TolC family protein [Flammeovirga yaeyamensis]|uniref:TolC family protein n=1 Tax=Flammeovirga yaeyamensis TaxID=367791 RepID=A0AAX1N3L1_9BACT|nr:TolC family protein [Flammeovirga yaeyamensis]MBB3700612.1 outer membrane protein [Flammeovirga yaeyamensis]NMF37728.1 TolC family protein [Flammeovirga yaeyamensis]QWG02037.1 TolC family protein [Flammeovirga yaeyamensis]
MKKWTYILLFISISSTVLAQDNWQLNDCINYALDHNLDIIQSTLEVKNSDINVKEAKWKYAPSFSGNINGNFNAGRSIDPNTNGYINNQFYNNFGNLNMNFTVFQGFKLKNEMQFQKYQQQAAQYNLQNAQEQLVFEIMQAYYDVEYFFELWKIAQDQIELSEKIVDRATIQKEVGLKAEADVAEMNAQLEKERLLSIQAFNNMMEAKANLINKMNFEESMEALHLTFTNTVHKVRDFGSAEDLFSSFQLTSSQIQSQYLILKSSEKQLLATKANYVPQITMNASLNTGYSQTNRDPENNIIPYSDQLSNNLNQTVGFSVFIPIFQQNTVRLNVQRAKLNRLQADNQLQKIRTETKRIVGNDLREWKALKAEITQGEKVKNSTVVAYDVALQKYEEGLIDIINLLTVKQKLGQAELDLLLARLKCQTKERLLMFYQGDKFWL